MSKIASVLQQEISRLARKEVNARTRALHKASAQYRREIAELKRKADALTRQVAFLEQQERKRVAEGVPAANVEGKRFSRRGLVAHRRKLGLSAADYGRLVGVSARTIYSWEQGESKPRDEQHAALLAVKELGKREALKRLELLSG